jgi:hypothetical protein
MCTLTFLVGQLPENNLLGDEIVFLALRGVPQLDEESGAEVAAADALELFKLLLVVDVSESVEIGRFFGDSGGLRTASGRIKLLAPRA